MAKKTKKTKKLTTNQAVERLLGRKAAKRIRKLAVQFVEEKEIAKAEKTKKANKRR